VAAMIKATLVTQEGKLSMLVLGLSFGNLKKFLEAPGDTYIKIKGEEINVDFDVLLFSGRTEAEMETMMKQFIGPNTKVKDTR
jgi:hypothetical protein